MKHANYRIRKDPSKRLLRHPVLTGLSLIALYGIGFVWFISHKQATSEERPKNDGSQTEKAEIKTADIRVDKGIPAEKNARAGEEVDVIKDNVHVRWTPENGLILGKLGREDQVVFIEKKQDWCHVKTPNDHRGWMICDALAL